MEPFSTLVTYNLVFISPTEAEHYKSNNVIIIRKTIYRFQANNHVNSGTLILNSLQRASLGLNEGDRVKVKFETMKPTPLTELAISVVYSIKPMAYDLATLNSEIKAKLKQIPILDLAYFVNINGNIISFKADDPKIDPKRYNIITAETHIKLINNKSRAVIETEPIKLFKNDIQLSDLGIGGLGEEFNQIFRRAFSTRLLSSEMLNMMAIDHVKGILLYGPPGCGKTLLARQIGKMLNCKSLRIINGPELLNKYVGQSEENARNVFKDAIEDKNPNNLHLIICDEFDALCHKRTGNDSYGSNVGNNIVNTMLSMLDGVNKLNNILFIGMTNRKELIDDALLRPGRLEIQIEINLPSEEGRYDILKIHTKSLAQNGCLASNVNLKYLAEQTENFTGAELAGLVRNASTYAIAKHIDISDVKSGLNIKPILTMADFKKSLREAKPMFGTLSDDINKILKLEYLDWNKSSDHFQAEIKSIFNQMKQGNKLKCLISGVQGIGKTFLACHLAKSLAIPYTKIITAKALLTKSELDKCVYIKEIFEMASQTDRSIIIIDNFEDIIEYVPSLFRFNNYTLQALIALLNSADEPTNKSLILITSRNTKLIKEFNIELDYEYEIKNLETEDIRERFRALKLGQTLI